MLDASLFDHSANYGDHCIVVIKPNTAFCGSYNAVTQTPPAFKGLLVGEVRVTYDSSWTPIDGANIPIVKEYIENMGSVFSGLTTVARGGEAGAVFKSKKLWSNSGDVKLSLDVRVIDQNGTGEGLMNAIHLIRFLTRRDVGKQTNIIAEAWNTTNSIINGFRNANIVDAAFNDPGNTDGGVIQAGAQLGEDVLDGVIKGAQDTMNKFSVLLDKGASLVVSMYDDIPASNGMTKNAKETLRNALSDFIMMKDSPLPCFVKVGNIFEHTDMVITGVKVKFSLQHTRATPDSEVYPLVTDFTIDMVSRTLMDGTVTGAEASGLGKYKGRQMDWVGKQDVPEPIATTPPPTSTAPTTMSHITVEESNERTTFLQNMIDKSGIQSTVADGVNYGSHAALATVTKQLNAKSPIKIGPSLDDVTPTVNPLDPYANVNRPIGFGGR